MSCREFGPIAESPVDRIVTSSESCEGGPENGLVQALSWLDARGIGQVLHDDFGDFSDLRTLILPGIVQLWQEIHHARASKPAMLWEIGACEERFFVGCHYHCHGPTTSTCHHLGDGHVNVVDVGAFLPIDLHANEPFIH